MPAGYFELPLSKAEVLKEGKDLTIVGYGSQIYTLEWAIKIAEEQMPGLSIELIDLRTLLPWDADTVEKVSSDYYLKMFLRSFMPINTTLTVGEQNRAPADFP